MLFMVIERFENRDPIPVYKRVRDAGIKFPEGLKYVVYPSQRCPSLSSIPRTNTSIRYIDAIGAP
jgi:hypothetical protein